MASALGESASDTTTSASAFSGASPRHLTTHLPFLAVAILPAGVSQVVRQDATQPGRPLLRRLSVKALEVGQGLQHGLLHQVRRGHLGPQVGIELLVSDGQQVLAVLIQQPAQGSLGTAAGVLEKLQKLVSVLWRGGGVHGLSIPTGVVRGKNGHWGERSKITTARGGYKEKTVFARCVWSHTSRCENNLLARDRH